LTVCTTGLSAALIENNKEKGQMWKNKHILIAVLVTPVLGLMGYFAVSTLVGEKPHAAEEGQSYLLVEKPNCRYNSGMCGLKNGDFELDLSFEWRGDDRMFLMLNSEHSLDGILVAMADPANDKGVPIKMLPVGDGGLSWALELPRPDPERHRLRLAASAGKVLYFGDAATKFTLDKDAE